MRWVIVMGFIRFESSERNLFSRAGYGIFQCDRGELHLRDSHIRDALYSEYDWFCDNLNAPDDVYYREGRRAARSGACWFRDTSKDHVNRGRHIAKLLVSAGVQVHQLRSNNPGAT
ncbi:MAG: hypothetical protein AAGA97_11350, partial [Pseudomonadota bacterium]